MCAEKESFASGKGLPPLAQGWTKILSYKVGSSPAFGSALDYNAGVPPLVASGHKSKTTASDRAQIHLGNSSNLIANERLRVPGRGFRRTRGGP